MITILGSPNSDDGALYDLGIERCKLAINQHRKYPESKFILTGGFGKHFNRSSKPHAAYLKEYLLGQGIQPNAILGLALSSNTIEDATQTMEIVLKHKISKILVITSDFHIDRASYIFRQIFDSTAIDIDFLGAPVNEHNSEIDIVALKKHEMWALGRLQQFGLDKYYDN